MDAAPSLHIWQQQQDLCPAPTTTRTQPSAVRIPASRTITAAATTTTSTHTPIAPPPASDTTIRASRVLIPSSAPIAPTVLVTATSSPTKRAGTYIYPSRDLRSARPTPFNLNKALVNKENESIERSEPIDRSEPPARKLMDSSRLRIRPNGPPPPPPPPKQPKQVSTQTQSHKERQDDGDRDVAQKELPRPPLQSRPPQVTSVPISSSSTVAEDDHPLPTPPNSIPTAPTKSEPESSLPRPSKLKPPGQQVGTSAGAPSKLPRPPTSTQPSSLPSLIRPPKTQHTVASSLPKPITHSLIRNKARLSPPSAMAGASASSSSDRSGGMMSRYAGTRLRARASLTASSSRVRVTKEVMAAASAAAAAKTAAAAAASASAEALSAPLPAPAQTEQVTMDVPAPPLPLGPSAITRPSPVLGTTALPSLIPMPASRIARPQTPAESKVPSIPQLQPAPIIVQPPPIRVQTKTYPTALTITAKELSKLTALHTRRNEVQAVRIRFKTVRVEGRRRPPSPTSRIRRVGEPVLGVGGDEDGEMFEGEENGPGAGPLDLVDAAAVVVGAERPSGEGSGKESPVGSDDLEGEGDAEVVEEEEGAEMEDKEAAVKVEGEDVAVDTEGWAEDGQDVTTQSRPQPPTRSASASSTTTTPSVPLRPRSLRILRSSSTPTAEAGGASAVSSSSSLLLSTGKRRVRWDEVPRKVKRFVPPLYRARLGVYAVGSASGASSSSSSAAGGMPTGSGAGVIVGRSCFASKVQDVKLDPLGNAPDADRPLPLQTQLRRTKVVVKRYVYDGEDEEDGGVREEQPMINVDVGGAGSSVSALRSGLTSASGPALRRGATVLGGGTL